MRGSLNDAWSNNGLDPAPAKVFEGPMLPQLADIPRVRLARTPTPLEFCPNLTASAAGANIWAKRDDETGLALGGNKVRQLEYYFGAARAENADTVLITGAVQSNFVRLAAAAAAKLGLACHVQLEERVATDDLAYRTSGNVLLDRLLGATIHTYPEGEDEAGADARIREIAEELRASGKRPYVIPLSPGHPPLGSLGYINCAEEIIHQCGRDGIPQFDEIVVASGSGSTHGGLLFGMRAFGSAIPVHGVCVRRSTELQKPRIENRTTEVADLLAMENPVPAEDVITDDTDLAPGYGKANRATREAIQLAAHTEALLTDPVYTGKVMATTLRRAAELGTGANILFLHTGGTPGIFAYPGALTTEE